MKAAGLEGNSPAGCWNSSVTCRITFSFVSYGRTEIPQGNLPLMQLDSSDRSGVG